MAKFLSGREGALAFRGVSLDGLSALCGKLVTSLRKAVMPAACILGTQDTDQMPASAQLPRASGF